MSKKVKEINIVQGNSKDLEISPVYTHLSLAKPKIKDNKNIVIPNNKKNK